jgi:thiamine-phosphate pyrophosphorylase
MAELRHRTQLCIAMTAEAGSAAAERMTAARSAAPIATLILRSSSSRPLDATAARALVTIGQKAGVAVLIENDARLARTLKADGVHLTASPEAEAAYAEAREIVGSGAIVGMDAGTSRHDAMSLGEAGADYVAFGVSPGADAASRSERADRIAWWAEIFEPPCVALDVADGAEAAALVEAGADFVTVTIPDGCTIADARDRVAELAAAIKSVQQVE